MRMIPLSMMSAESSGSVTTTARARARSISTSACRTGVSSPTVRGARPITAESGLNIVRAGRRRSTGARSPGSPVRTMAYSVAPSSCLICATSSFVEKGLVT